MTEREGHLKSEENRSRRGKKNIKVHYREKTVKGEGRGREANTRGAMEKRGR